MGVANNLGTMKASEMVKRNLHNSVGAYYLENNEARAKIKKFFSNCKRHECKPALDRLLHSS